MNGCNTPTNIHKIEIEITTDCNLWCINCDRSSRQAASEEGMTIAQIERFVAESIEQRWRWDTISLMGGEPTLHPDLPVLISRLDAYRQFNPDVEIRIKTNGVYGSKIRRMLAELPSWVLIRSSEKKGPVHTFATYNVAPVDLEEFRGRDFGEGCWITRRIGMGLTRYGYYPCGAGASVDRVFGLDIGIKRLADVTLERLSAQLRELCRLCGHFKDGPDGADARRKEWVREEQMSPTWTAAYERYHLAAPRLSLYGDTEKSASNGAVNPLDAEWTAVPLVQLRVRREANT